MREMRPIFSSCGPYRNSTTVEISEESNLPPGQTSSRSSFPRCYSGALCSRCVRKRNVYRRELSRECGALRSMPQLIAKNAQKPKVARTCHVFWVIRFSTCFLFPPYLSLSCCRVSLTHGNSARRWKLLGGHLHARILSLPLRLTLSLCSFFLRRSFSLFFSFFSSVTAISSPRKEKRGGIVLRCDTIVLDY